MPPFPFSLDVKYQQNLNGNSIGFRKAESTSGKIIFNEDPAFYSTFAK